jgi:hypothetical protein
LRTLAIMNQKYCIEGMVGRQFVIIVRKIRGKSPRWRTEKGRGLFFDLDTPLMSTFLGLFLTLNCDEDLSTPNICQNFYWPFRAMHVFLVFPSHDERNNSACSKHIPMDPYRDLKGVPWWCLHVIAVVAPNVHILIVVL